MKKISFMLAIVIVLSFVFAGCSNHSQADDILSMETLKKLKVSYSIPDDIVEPENPYPDMASKMSARYVDGLYNGFVAKVEPIEYIFYFTPVLNDTNGLYNISGYAECRCRIVKMSQKYVSAEYGEEEILVRQRIVPRSINRELFLKIREEIGMYKDGSYVEGAFRIPAKYINEDNFEIEVFEERGMLLGEEPYYVEIDFLHDIPWFGYVYNEDEGCIPNNAIDSAMEFKDFLLTCDPELMN